MSHLTASGVRVLDSSGSHTRLDELGETFDAIQLLGVIEHIPYTMKPLLVHLVEKLAPGGFLIVDTPNLAYLYKREAAAAGLSTHLSIQLQFDCPLPFEGHHIVYNQAELRWMLERVGSTIVEEDLFNYSIYAHSEIGG